jgi:hypothetical protein
VLRGRRVAKQLCHPITVNLKTKTLFRHETVVTVAVQKTWGSLYHVCAPYFPACVRQRGGMICVVMSVVGNFAPNVLIVKRQSGGNSGQLSNSLQLLVNGYYLKGWRRGLKTVFKCHVPFLHVIYVLQNICHVFKHFFLCMMK